MAVLGEPLDTTFTYQGQLKQSGAPFTGTADLECKLFDAFDGGIQIGSTVAVNNLAVTDGLFTAPLNFGPGVFNGDSRFLQIAVRSPAGAGNFTPLNPRQPLTAVPYALYALSGPGSGGPWAINGNNVFNTNIGNVGIGTTAPQRALHVAADAAALRLQDDDNPASYSVLEDWQPAIMRIMKFTGIPGASLIDFNPMPSDGAGNATIRVFRETNTTGVKAMYFYRGNNTHVTDAAITVGGANSYFQLSGGNFGIGTPSPATPLHLLNPDPVLVLQDSGSNATQVGYLGLWNSSGTETGWLGFGTPGSPDFGIQNKRSGGDIYLLPGSGGNVVISKASALTSMQLEVDGAVNSTGGFSTNHSYRYVGSLGEYWRMGARSVFPVCSGANIEPFLELKSPYSGNVQVEIYRDCQSARGVIIADEKHFRAPNPADPATDIWYCSLEGPEAAMYVRGTGRLTNGRTTIELPDHFRNLASEAGMTVQVTPLSIESKGLAVTKKSLAGIEVGELGGGTGDYEFDWRVEAVRKGHENYQVIRPWKSSDPDEAQAWQNRMRWIEERRAYGNP
jgi:hypothetical protein